ncbi:MAG: RDD family protein [Candidatus Sulfotelmatobacter sp.]
MPETAKLHDIDHLSEPAANSFGEESTNLETPAFIPAPATAKIIEFPRSWTPPLPALDELAEPVVDRPRILEAPEIIPPPPALGGITIEPVRQPEPEKRPGIDIPLQSAPLERRILAAAVDGLIITAFCGVFALIFWKLTAIRPPRMQILGVIAGLASVLWAAYQYLLLVYAGTTSGLRVARLELLRFDEKRATRRLRRWRVLASFLSAASLGMGYVWVFLDEDSLCWHDRITHTYLAPRKRESVRAESTIP